MNNYHGTVALYNSKKNTYEFICDEGWDINDAHVICRMLGFPGALDATVRSEYGLPRTRDAGLSNIQCNGTESSIYDCPYKHKLNCSSLRSAGVQCLSKLLFKIILFVLFTTIPINYNFIVECMVTQEIYPFMCL